MNTKDINYQNDNNVNEDLTNVVGPTKFGGRLGVLKRSVRPNKSLKPHSLLPKKFKSVSRIQKKVNPQVKNSELI